MVEKIITEIIIAKTHSKVSNTETQRPFLDEEASRDSISVSIGAICGNIYLHASFHVLLRTRHRPESASEHPLLCSFGEVSSKVTSSQKSVSLASLKF